MGELLADNNHRYSFSRHSSRGGAGMSSSKGKKDDDRHSRVVDLSAIKNHSPPTYFYSKKSTKTTADTADTSSTEVSGSDSSSCSDDEGRIIRALNESKERIDRAREHMHTQQMERGNSSEISLIMEQKRQELDRQRSRSQSRSEANDSSRDDGCFTSRSRPRRPTINSRNTTSTDSTPTTLSKNLFRIEKRLDKVKALLEMVEQQEPSTTNRRDNNDASKASSTLIKAKTLLEDMEKQERAKAKAAAARGRTMPIPVPTTPISRPASSTRSSPPPSSRGRSPRPGPDEQLPVEVYDANRNRSQSQPRPRPPPTQKKQQRQRSVDQHPQRRSTVPQRRRSARSKSRPRDMEPKKTRSEHQHSPQRRMPARSKSRSRDLEPRKASSRPREKKGSEKNHNRVGKVTRSNNRDEKQQRSRSSRRSSTREEHHHQSRLDSDLRGYQYRPATKQRQRSRSTCVKPSSSRKNGSDDRMRRRSKSLKRRLSSSGHTVLEAAASLAMQPTLLRERKMDQRRAQIPSPPDEEGRLRRRERRPVSRSNSPYRRSHALVSDSERRLSPERPVSRSNNSPYYRRPRALGSDEEGSDDDASSSASAHTPVPNNGSCRNGNRLAPEVDSSSEDENSLVNSIGEPTQGRRQPRRQALRPIDMSRVETALEKIRLRHVQDGGHEMEMKQKPVGHQKPPPPPPPRKHQHPPSDQIVPLRMDPPNYPSHPSNNHQIVPFGVDYPYYHPPYPHPNAQVPPTKEEDVNRRNDDWMKYTVTSCNAAGKKKDQRRLSKTSSNVPDKLATADRQALRVVKDMPFTDSQCESGLYSGQVNENGRPDGKGSMKYNNGIFFEGAWTDGCQDEMAASQYNRIRSGFTSWGGKGKGAVKSGRTTPFNATKIDKHDENEKTNVRGLEWTDLNGDSGRYTGEVNRDEIPHGKGIMKYDYGLIAEGEWANGVLKENPHDRMMAASSMASGGAMSMSFMSSAPSLSVGPGMGSGMSSFMSSAGSLARSVGPVGVGSAATLSRENMAQGSVYGGSMMSPMMMQPQQHRYHPYPVPMLMNFAAPHQQQHHMVPQQIAMPNASPVPLVNNDESSMEMRPPAPIPIVSLGSRKC